MAKYDQCILCGYHSSHRSYHPEYRVCSKCEQEITKDGRILSFPRRKIFMTWYQADLRSRQQGFYSDLSLEDTYKLYDDCGGACSVTGIPFNLRHREDTTKYPFMPAIDRLDPDVGYTKDNCRIICNIVNYAKDSWSSDLFEYLFKNYENLLNLKEGIAVIDRAVIGYKVASAKLRTSKYNNMNFNITADYIEHIIKEQNYRCSITNIPFNNLHKNSITRRGPFSAALTRRDRSLGFVEGNVLVVCCFLSAAKLTFNENIFKTTFNYIEEYNTPLWDSIKGVVGRWNL